MIKFGVTQRNDFARYALEREQQHRGWWPFAYTLLAGESSSDLQFEEALTTRLYESLAAGDGVYKITRPGRFTQLDEQLALDGLKRFPMDRQLVVHDIAASNGITSLEMYRRLSRDRAVEFHTSDYFDQLYLVTPPHSSWTVAFDTTGRPLQLSNGRFVVSAYRKEPLRYVVNRVIQSLAWKNALPQAIEQFRQFRESGHSDCVRVIRLFHSECLREADSPGTQFHLLRHDAFTPNPFRCDIVRILNFLTLRHITHDQIEQGIQAACHGLRERGLLLLGRTIDEGDGRITATAFERGSQSLRVAWNVGGGYEHEEFALRVRLQEPTS